MIYRWGTEDFNGRGSVVEAIAQHCVDELDNRALGNVVDDQGTQYRVRISVQLQFEKTPKLPAESEILLE